MPHLELPVYYPLRARSDGAANVVLKTPRVPLGEVWVINRITFEDETTAFTEARVFRGTEQNPGWLGEQTAPQAATLYWDDGEHIIGENEEVGVRFNGTTTGDQLRAWVSGKRIIGPFQLET